MIEKCFTFLYIKLLYIKGEDFFDTQHKSLVSKLTSVSFEAIIEITLSMVLTSRHFYHRLELLVSDINMLQHHLMWIRVCYLLKNFPSGGLAPCSPLAIAHWSSNPCLIYNGSRKKNLLSCKWTLLLEFIRSTEEGASRGGGGGWVSMVYPLSIWYI